MANETKQRLLQVATTLFVEQGYAATSMREIAKAAEISLSVIYYHFTNKEDLWHAVKARIGTKRDFNLPESIPCFDRLEDLIWFHAAIQLKAFRKNPGLTKLAAWQKLEDNLDEATHFVGFDKAAWLESIEHMQDNGQIDPCLDKIHVYALLQSITAGTISDPHQEFFADCAQAEQYVNMLVQTICISLQPK